jgi:hypothetical protein
MGVALMLATTTARADWIFAANESNDLYKTAKSSGLVTQRADTPAAALALAQTGDGVLLLANDYPARQTPVPDDVYASAAAKHVRLYVEYPAALPNMEIAAPRKMEWERAVVTSDAFGPALARMRILMIQDCTYLPMVASAPHLVLARVVGFDVAKLGLPATKVWPILFEHQQSDILVATTRLSQFIASRHAPTDAWRALWPMVFKWFWKQSDGRWSGKKYSPHYQAYQWAVNLWLYDKTRFEPILSRTKSAIDEMMRRFPDGWDCEANRQDSERARMLLPLAWLIRIEDTPQHRAWLDQVANYVIDAQDECGAIRQIVDHPGGGNASYGTGECPLVYESGDPATDLLYTTNFAFFGLHEAAAATGDVRLKRAAERIADFLIRIQIRSDKHAMLDGAWFRGFDFRRWDYWGSNADVGWGIWATESGWTQGWITSVLALRQMQTSYWDLTRKHDIAKHFAAIRQTMLPDAMLVKQPSP